MKISSEERVRQENDRNRLSQVNALRSIAFPIARTGTDGRLFPAAVPGALGEAPPSRKKSEVGPTFVSDAVAEDWEAFAEFRTGEAAAPQKPSSPFVDDAVRDFLEEETKP